MPSSNKNTMNNYNRRKFIKQLSCSAVGSSTLFSTLINLRAANSAAIANSAVTAANDYKALVCITLAGGNDSFNMLVPKSGAAYNDYKNSRSNLALDSNSLLGINPLNTGGQQFGLHPSMPKLQGLFNQGKLSFISNVGSLVEPALDKQDVWNERIKLPLGLYSHADQLSHWQTATPHIRSAAGWGGKVADMIRDMNTNQNISMNISLSGTNTFQTGNQTIEYTLDPTEGSIGINGDNNDYLFNQLRRKGIDNLLDHNYQDVFKKAYAKTIKGARNADVEFSSAIEGNEFSGVFDTDEYEFMERLHMVARTIKARNTLNMSRQTFFVEFRGWDHHDEVLNTQADMLTMVDNGLSAFQNSLQQLGIEDQVTTFVISDFGRTLTSNGNGTDHGWGGNVFAMGGAVNGQRIFGEYPSLRLESDLDLGSGRLMPTLSADEYFAELSLWFGVPPSDLKTIFPNLGNFYNVNSGVAPIGFLNI